MPPPPASSAADSSPAPPSTSQVPTAAARASRLPRAPQPAGDDSALPGSVLQSSNLTPETLANNLRAGLFPLTGHRIRVGRGERATTGSGCSSTLRCAALMCVSLMLCLCQNTISHALARQAWLEVSAVERLHRHRCPHITLTRVKPYGDEAANSTTLRQWQTQSSRVASAGRPCPPLIRCPLSAVVCPVCLRLSALCTRLYSALFREQPFPHLTIFKPSPLPPPVPYTETDDNAVTQTAAATSAASSAPPAALGSAVHPVDPTGPLPVTYYGARLLGTELWTVDRCRVEQQYMVSYYADGDAFYASLCPVNWSGTADCLRLKLTAWLGLQE